MKKLILTIAMGTVLAACQPEADKSVTAEEETKPNQQETTAVKEENKIGYALGAKMATFIRNDLDKYKMPGVSKKAVAEGFNDALKSQSKMNEQQIEQQFALFQQAVQAAHQQAQVVAEADAMAKAKEESKAEIEAGDAFLAANAKKEGVKVTESGIQYRVISEGKADGAKPTATDTVRVHYHGTFIDGKVFDSSVDRKEPTEFPLNRVIKGWTEGLQLMPIGSKYHFVIPWELAYGWQGRPGGIPGFSVLQFEVELLEINPKAEAKNAKKSK